MPRDFKARPSVKARQFGRLAMAPPVTHAKVVAPADPKAVSMAAEAAPNEIPPSLGQWGDLVCEGHPIPKVSSA